MHAFASLEGNVTLFCAHSQIDACPGGKGGTFFVLGFSQFSCWSKGPTLALLALSSAASLFSIQT
eukprot:m.10416 g.10416  ORF g.10416 m.10416 type:complete len:65 (+) comp5599_c0_seq1:656-850(+)